MAKARSNTKIAGNDKAQNGQLDTPVVAFTRHDHRRCRRSAMNAVVSLCATRQLRLTPARQRTLEILLESHIALGAYEVLEKLAASGFGEKPPQVYRALGFLIEQGFAHKIERLNAYIACAAPQVCSQPCFMVCAQCGRVAEQSVPKASKQLAVAANQLGFSPKASVIEISGLCHQCEVHS